MRNAKSVVDNYNGFQYVRYYQSQTALFTKVVSFKQTKQKKFNLNTNVMKKFIMKIPLIGNLSKQIYRTVIQPQAFKTSGEYWEKRYRSGGNSGAGSYNNLAEFKGEIINLFIDNKKIDSVIEFGCGDGNQLKYLRPQRYLGYDISEKAIQLCSEIYKKDDTKSFKNTNSYNSEKADLTMSLDVIYHLIEKQTYLNYMNTLFDASNKYVIIYSSNTDYNMLNAAHVKNRKFTDWVEKNRQDFSLFEHIPNKYPFDGDGTQTSFSDFFLYEKIALKTN